MPPTLTGNPHAMSAGALPNGAGLGASLGLAGRRGGRGGERPTRRSDAPERPPGRRHP